MQGKNKDHSNWHNSHFWSYCLPDNHAKILLHLKKEHVRNSISKLLPSTRQKTSIRRIEQKPTQLTALVKEKRPSLLISTFLTLFEFAKNKMSTQFIPVMVFCRKEPTSRRSALTMESNSSDRSRILSTKWETKLKRERLRSQRECQLFQELITRLKITPKSGSLLSRMDYRWLWRKEFETKSFQKLSKFHKLLNILLIFYFL